MGKRTTFVGLDVHKATIAVCVAQERPDTAILRLLYGVALRRGEVVKLDLADVDLAAGRILVLGKARGSAPVPAVRELR